MRLHHYAILFCFSAIFSTQTAFAQTSPATDDLLYAQKLFKEGYYDLCLAQLGVFRERYPDAQELAEVWKLDGEANLALRRYGAAEAAYRTFEIRYPFHQSIEDIRLRLAESQKLQGHVEHAALTLQRFVALHPRSERAPLALYQACAAWQELREYEKARAGLYALIENYPQSTLRLSAHLLLVQSFSAAGENERALQEAERTLRSFPETLLNAQAYFFYGRLQEQVGHYQLAEQNYLELLKKFPKDEMLPATHARLAELQFARGDLAAAVGSLGLAAQTASAKMKNALALRAAEMHLRFDQTSEAVAALQKFEAVASDSAMRLIHFYLLGTLHEKLDKREAALQAYQQATQLSTATESASDSANATPLHRRQRSLWRTAQLQFEARQYDAALQVCRQYRREYPHGSLRDALLFLEGRVQQSGFENLTLAQRLFDELLRDFPQSVFVDEAQFALAKTYEDAHELRLAQLQWQRFLQLYPASPLAEAAQNKLHLLAATTTTDSPEALSQLSEALLQANEKASREEFLISLARLNYERRNHRAALRFAHMANESAETTANTREAAYLLGACYFQLAERARWQNENASALQDSARRVLQSLSAGERDALSAKSEAVLARLWFTNETPRESATLARADSLLTLHEAAPEFDFLRLWAARARKSLSASNDTTASVQITNALQQVAANLENPARDEALYELATWQWQRGDSSNAMRSLEAMRESKVHAVFFAKGQLRQAQWLAQQKRHEAARGLLQRMKEEYFYCAFADSATVQLTKLYILMGKFKEALSHMESVQEQKGGDDLMRARMHETMGDHAQAVQAYLRFLAQHPEAPEVATVLLEAARLTQRAGAEHLARGYYEECARRFPGTEYSVEAKFRLAEMHYDKEAFELAQPLYLEAMNEQPNAPRAKEALKQWILCLYKTKNFARAEIEAKKFEELNKSERASIAELQYAAGEAAIAAKDFVSAERILRKLSKDYRDTPSGILGDYGLGKALLIQTKTEEALETLTDIPKRYPKHPFLHTVYLGLGDFYQAQQQWDNALTAFSQVTKDSLFDNNYRLAVRSLLDVYDRMGLKDRALALARHYVARFPQDVKALDLKLKVGLLLIDLAQFDDAVAHFKRLKPFVDATVEPEVQYYIGKSHMNAGRFELAIAELLRVKFFSKPSKLPWDVIAMYDAATCYTRINNCGMAKKLFQQIVREQGAGSDFGRFANTKVAELSACQAAN